MDTETVLSRFVEFYRERGHRRVTGSTLLTGPGDPVLFTSSGMHPLTRYLEGVPHPMGRRLVNVQRCLRTTDIDEVGDSSHLTVFEMLGSWSLGDYDGPQSLRWGHELLRDVLGIGPERLYVTVFGGDGQVGPDRGSLRTWQGLGVPVEVCGPQNWWSNGPVGPCGPDSEVFVWTGDGPPEGTPGTDGRWMEIWNHVTMRYRRHPDGSLSELVQPNVDTGMGLERLLMVMQGKPSVFECDLFEPWLRTVPGLWGLGGRRLRLVCDHLRSSLVVIGDGPRPSNTRHGYVLRRLLRRSLTTLWEDDPSRTLSDLPVELLLHTGEHFRQTVGTGSVRDVLLEEERRFRSLLDRGRKLLRRRRSPDDLTGDDLDYLHRTHGLPPDLVRSLMTEHA
jgi:alanyl-tRNA synthetase